MDNSKNSNVASLIVGGLLYGAESTEAGSTGDQANTATATTGSDDTNIPDNNGFQTANNGLNPAASGLLGGNWEESSALPSDSDPQAHPLVSTAINDGDLAAGNQSYTILVQNGSDQFSGNDGGHAFESAGSSYSNGHLPVFATYTGETSLAAGQQDDSTATIVNGLAPSVASHIQDGVGAPLSSISIADENTGIGHQPTVTIDSFAPGADVTSAVTAIGTLAESISAASPQEVTHNSATSGDILADHAATPGTMASPDAVSTNPAARLVNELTSGQSYDQHSIVLDVADNKGLENQVLSVLGPSASLDPTAVAGSPLVKIDLGHGMTVQQALNEVYNSHIMPIGADDDPLATPNYLMTPAAISTMTADSPSLMGSPFPGGSNNQQYLNDINDGPTGPSADGITGQGAVIADVDTGVDYTNSTILDNIWLNNAILPAFVKQNVVDDNGNPMFNSNGTLINPDNPVTFETLNNSYNSSASSPLAPYIHDLIGQDGNSYFTFADMLDLGSNYTSDAAMSSSSPWYNATPDPATGKMNAYIGWNTGMNDDNPFDNGYPGEPHGTATLSTEAQGAPGALIMALNFYGYNDNDGSYYSADQMQTLAQELGAENGVTYMITNNSYGGGLPFGALGGDAYDTYNNPNYLAVISAGNSTYNNDLPQTSEVNYATTIYPAFFSTGPDALTVAATNTGATTLAGFSDYGPESVNVAAPGNTVTAIWGGSFAGVEGTSFAGPLAAAVSALVQGYAESEGITLTPEQIIQIVESTVTTSSSLTGQVSTDGEVNAEAAVTDNVPTAPLNAITSSPGQITYGAASGTSVGITASSVDINASGAVTYSLTNNANGAYQINSSTGVVTVANSADIGDGAFPFQTITVTASGNTSGGEESASSNLLIKVNSSNFDPSSISGMTLWANAATANVNGSGAATSLQDLSGNGETLLPENPLSNSISIVQHNGVAEFAPGTNGFVEAVDNNVSSGILGSYYTGSTNWTVATAFDPSQITGNATLLQGEASNGDGAVVIENGLLGEYDNSGGSGFKSSGFNITTLTTGYHALVAVDTGGTIKFYVDGTDVGSVSNTIGVSMGGVESLFNSLSGNQGFATPEIMVYDQAVTSPQVTSLSNYLTEEFSQGSSTGITLPGAATIDVGQTHAFGPTITGGSGTDTLTLADSNVRARRSTGVGSWTCKEAEPTDRVGSAGRGVW